MDFIDAAIEKQRIRLGIEKEKQKAETEEAERRDHEIRAQVSQLISSMVLPVISNAKWKLEKKAINAEVHIETSLSIDSEKNYYKGAKLQINKRLDRRSEVPIVIGPSLYFSASPPYSTAIAIVAYGKNNDPIFSERFDLSEMTDELVMDHLKWFVTEVIK